MGHREISELYVDMRGRETTFDKLTHTVANDCNLEGDKEQTEKEKSVPWCEFRVTPHKKAPGHLDPGAAVPQPHRAPPPLPSVCAWLPDGCWALSALHQSNTDLNSRLITWKCVHCTLYFCSPAVICLDYHHLKMLFVNLAIKYARNITTLQMQWHEFANAMIWGK